MSLLDELNGAEAEITQLKATCQRLEEGQRRIVELEAINADQNDALTYLADWLGLPLRQDQRCRLCEWSRGEHTADCPAHKVMAAIAKAKEKR